MFALTIYFTLKRSHLHCELCLVPGLLGNTLDDSTFGGTLHNSLFDPENLHYILSMFSIKLHIQQFLNTFIMIFQSRKENV